eukprot:GHVU01023520.1.p2 GENE.GHVU01023520.1~~GHVU01023520.1.p2  ORF type:complete len:128 (+),score=0.51 GHVU01023520.1:1621-2004(+)
MVPTAPVCRTRHPGDDCTMALISWFDGWRLSLVTAGEQHIRRACVRNIYRRSLVPLCVLGLDADIHTRTPITKWGTKNDERESAKPRGGDRAIYMYLGVKGLCNACSQGMDGWPGASVEIPSVVSQG